MNEFKRAVEDEQLYRAASFNFPYNANYNYATGELKLATELATGESIHNAKGFIL